MNGQRNTTSGRYQHIATSSAQVVQLASEDQLSRAETMLLLAAFAVLASASALFAL